eukprot:TRINITY_DN57927_c0_g1_i1.p1 TRINITY_DN57927_c0_g1~~TRINITY_DN57927_c0_g1_i1.p1  ORF type:complete len:407 (-),score=88.91 TRINITY_DN57927_c0_g1_i1:124-1269(-)
MLPVILAGVAACVAAAAYASSRDDSGGPKHKPGGEQSEQQRKKTAEEAQKKAEEKIKRAKKEFDEKLEREQEKLKADAEKAAEEARKKADAEFAKKAEEIRKEAAEQALRERCQKEREEYPMPSFLRDAGGTEKANWGFVGDSGQGKSSFVNYLLGEKAAKVGVGEPTMKPTPYSRQGFRHSFWDLPGAGISSFPKETYIQEFGLRYFDVVFIVSAGRWKEHDLEIIKELKKHEVPHFVVRTKVDVDIDNNYLDDEVGPEDTLAELRDECKQAGLEKAYFITTRDKHLKMYVDLFCNQKLVNDIISELAKVRSFSDSEHAYALQVLIKSLQPPAPTSQRCSMPQARSGTVSPKQNQLGLAHPSGTIVRMVSALARAARHLR